MYWISNFISKEYQRKLSYSNFDDPVNAIDDEHRGAIRETLFNTLISNKPRLFSPSMVKNSSIILIKYLVNKKLLIPNLISFLHKSLINTYMYIRYNVQKITY